MAEFVQQSLEEMLPEVEQMERIGLFSASETRAIINRRKRLEYKLRRRQKRKEDHLQYIQYEMNVLALVKKRRERLGYNFKRVEIDVAIVQRIHKLFKLACLRFQTDVKLWLSHIDFCKSRREKASIGRLYTKMLKLHTLKPELWLAAAKWEMEENLSMENARGLLQRALNFIPNSKVLWQEYFRMELLNADKLLKRKEILGLAGMDSEQERIPDVVTEGKIALVVYKKAVDTIPDDVEFGLSFLPIARIFTFAGAVEEEIFSELQDTYAGREIIWYAKAVRILAKAPQITTKTKEKAEKETTILECEGRAFAVLDEAVSQIPSEKMWSLYIQTCLERIPLKSSKSLTEKRICRALMVLERASTNAVLTEDLALEWINLLKKLGLVEKLSTVTAALVEGKKLQSSAPLWLERLRWLATQGDGQQFYSEWEKAISLVEEKEALPVFEFGLQWASSCDQEKVEPILERGLISGPEVSLFTKEAYLEWAAISQGPAKAKQLYKLLTVSKPLSLGYFTKYISILSSQPEPKMKRLRQVYEDAILEYGDCNTDLWLEFIRLELTHPKGNPENATKIHWRAKKALDSSLIERFTTQYTLLQNDKL